MWYYEGGIRIEPDWNVKGTVDPKDRWISVIRIEPDWNVKFGLKTLTQWHTKH